MLVVHADHPGVSVDRGVVPAPQFGLGASATIRSKVGHCVRSGFRPGFLPVWGPGFRPGWRPGWRPGLVWVVATRISNTRAGAADRRRFLAGCRSFVVRLSFVFRGDRCDGEGCLARRVVLVFVPFANATFVFGVGVAVGFGVAVHAGVWRHFCVGRVSGQSERKTGEMHLTIRCMTFMLIGCRRKRQT